MEDVPQDPHPRHVVAVSGIVTDPHDRVLLVKGDRRGWEPPGGQVELGEDLVEALEREILEESGVRVEVSSLVGVYSNRAGRSGAWPSRSTSPSRAGGSEGIHARATSAPRRASSGRKRRDGWCGRCNRMPSSKTPWPGRRGSAIGPTGPTLTRSGERAYVAEACDAKDSCRRL